MLDLRDHPRPDHADPDATTHAEPPRNGRCAPRDRS
jgi:hypothetical protein